MSISAERAHEVVAHGSMFLASIWMSIIGALIGVGQLLGSSDMLTPRVVIGRALTSGGLAMCASVVLIWYPDIHPVALAGIAATLASLGTSFLSMAASRLLDKALK